LAKRDLWVDRPSAGIPFLYVRTGAELSAALAGAGLTSEASKIAAQTRSIARGAQLEDVLASMAK
jgi:hypothetical protein